MDLDFRQTRHFLLAGTVPFPTPYPSSGVISFGSGSLQYAVPDPAKTKDPAEAKDPAEKAFVAVQDISRRDRVITRVMLRGDVAAIFIPGSRDSDGNFHISREPTVDDFEEGAWFVDTEVEPTKVVKRLTSSKCDDIASLGSELRGIVFVVPHARVLSIAEVGGTALASSDIVWPDEMLRMPCCPCG